MVLSLFKNTEVVKMNPPLPVNSQFLFIIPYNCERRKSKFVKKIIQERQKEIHSLLIKKQMRYLSNSIENWRSALYHEKV